MSIDKRTLTLKERESFYTALLSAFPSRDSLSRVLTLKLGWSLEEIAGPANLRDASLLVVRHAETIDRVDALVEAAHAANSGNQALDEFYQSFIGSSAKQAPGSQTHQAASSPVKAAARGPFKLIYHCSPDDSSFGKALEKQLLSFKKTGLIEHPWSEADIRPGQTRDLVIRSRWNDADFILLVVSANFLAEGDEYLRMAERRRSEGAVVVPIIARSCLWQSSWLGQLQAYPIASRAVKPVSQWSEQADAWLNVIEALKGMAEERRDGAAGSGSQG